MSATARRRWGRDADEPFGPPGWSFIFDPLSYREPEWVRDQFRGNPWRRVSYLSHSRVLIHDERGTPVKLIDWWGPDELIGAAQAAEPRDADMLEFIRGGAGWRPCRAIEWAELSQPGPEERSLLKLAPEAGAYSVSRRYLNVREKPILLQHRRVRLGTVLRFDRNLLWEHATTKGLVPVELPGSESSCRCGGGQ